MLNIGSWFSYFINSSIWIGEVHKWIDVYYAFSILHFLSWDSALCRTALDYTVHKCPAWINICYEHQGIQTDDKCHDNLGLLMDVIIHYKNTTNSYWKASNWQKFLTSFNIQPILNIMKLTVHLSQYLFRLFRLQSTLCISCGDNVLLCISQ
jgi:hypothetical protein